MQELQSDGRIRRMKSKYETIAAEGYELIKQVRNAAAVRSTSAVPL
jgi:hypothetical protein